MKKTVKKVLCILLVFAFVFGMAAVSVAEGETYFTSFSVSGKNDMTLTFKASDGSSFDYRVAAVILLPSDTEDDNLAVFTPKDTGFHAIRASYTVRVNSKKQNVYKFRLDDVVSNEIVETPFIQACDAAYLYLYWWVSYDREQSDFTLNGFDGLMTKKNVNDIVNFLMPILASFGSYSDEDYVSAPFDWTYTYIKFDTVYKIVSKYFTITQEQLKKTNLYTEEYSEPAIKVHTPLLNLMLNLFISVEKSENQWLCKMGYVAETGDPITFTLTMNEKLQMIKSVSDPRYQAGDINGDGFVDITDAMLLFYAVARKTELTDDQLLRAESNMDGVIDITDAMALFYYVSKKEDRFFTNNAE